MSTRLLGTVLASIAVLAVSITSTARAVDAINMRPAFKAGESLSYSLAMTLQVNQEGGGVPASETRSTSSATFKLMLDEVAEDRSIKGRIEFTKAKVTAPAGDGREIGFEFPSRGELPENAPAEQKLGPLVGAAKLAFSVDPSGSVTITSGFEDFLGAVGKLERPDTRLLGFFTPEQFGALIGPIFTVDGAGETERLAGQGWQTSELIPLPPIGAFSVTHNWSAMGLDNKLARYSGASTFEFRRSTQAPETAPSVNLVEADGSTLGGFDVAFKLLSERKSSATIKTEWRAESINLIQTQTSIVNLKFNP